MKSIPEKSYLEINRKSWNNRTEVHFSSDFYDVKGFLEGKTSLNDIELGLLGDVREKEVLHLQCHFGQDSVALGRLGAKVTGVDFSDRAIQLAKELAIQDDTQVDFICADIYDLPNSLKRKFDIVYTSYGTIGWLPNINKWASIVSHFLKPNGRFVFVEFHPVVWMFDDHFKKIIHSYFNTGPILESEKGTYADKEANIEQDYVMWNHSLGDVVNGLIRSGLELGSLDEYDYSPYDCFEGTQEIGPNKYRIAHLDDKIPMVYAIRASKKNGLKD